MRFFNIPAHLQELARRSAAILCGSPHVEQIFLYSYQDSQDSQVSGTLTLVIEVTDERFEDWLRLIQPDDSESSTARDNWLIRFTSACYLLRPGEPNRQQYNPLCYRIRQIGFDLADEYRWQHERDDQEFIPPPLPQVELFLLPVSWKEKETPQPLPFVNGKGLDAMIRFDSYHQQFDTEEKTE